MQQPSEQEIPYAGHPNKAQPPKMVMKIAHKKPIIPSNTAKII